MDRSTWARLIGIEKEFRRRGECFSRDKIKDAMGVTISQARLLDWGLKHKDVIRHKPSTIEVEQNERVLGLFDIHIPYQDDAAVEAALAYADEYKPTMIIIGGDLLDFYQCSSFTRKPENKDTQSELKQCHSFLVDLRKRFPSARMIFKEGNHEDRFERYVLQNAREIYSLVNDLIIQKLDLPGLNIEYKKEFFRIGKLWWLHGHERPTGGDPEYICNVVFKYVLDHFICGHHHRPQDKIFRRIDGGTYFGGACGYLAGAMDYAPINKWNQGIVTVDYSTNGRVRAQLHKIQDGEVY